MALVGGRELGFVVGTSQTLTNLAGYVTVARASVLCQANITLCSLVPALAASPGLGWLRNTLASSVPLSLTNSLWPRMNNLLHMSVPSWLMLGEPTILLFCAANQFLLREGYGWIRIHCWFGCVLSVYSSVVVLCRSLHHTQIKNVSWLDNLFTRHLTKLAGRCKIPVR